MTYRIEAATKEEWAERAFRAEERIKDLETDVQTLLGFIKILEDHDLMPSSRELIAAANRHKKRIRVEALEEVLAFPKRREVLGGQTFSYVKCENIRALIDKEGSQ